MSTAALQAKASFSQFRDNLDDFGDNLDQATVVTRRGHQSLVMIPSREWSSIMETFHLIRCPANLRAIRESIKESHGKHRKSETVDEIIGRAFKRAKASKK